MSVHVKGVTSTFHLKITLSTPAGYVEFDADSTPTAIIENSDPTTIYTATTAVVSHDALGTYSFSWAPTEAGTLTITWTFVVASVVYTSVETIVVFETAPLPGYTTPASVTNTGDQEIIYFTAATLAGNNGNPHVGALIIMSDANGVQVSKTITQADGTAVAYAWPGTYTVTLVKSGVSYSVNNWSLTVVDTSAETGNNTFQLVTAAFTPTVSDPASPASLSKITATLFRMDGTPLRGAEIIVSLLHRPQLFSGAGVFDTKKVYVTDSNGYVELWLVQGITVEVVIAPLSLRRVITVPNDAGPNNLLTAMSTADDPLDIITPNIPTAPSRTL